MANKPNMQNINPKTPEAETIHKAFAERFELAAMDFEEIEKRMVAQFLGLEPVDRRRE